MNMSNIDFSLYDKLPDGPASIEEPPGVHTSRRFTAADVEFLEDHKEFSAALEEMADKSHEREFGLSRAEWERCPDHYTDYCCKGCYEDVRYYKGSVVEFGVRGVYICPGCGYALAPIDSRDVDQFIQDVT